YVLGAPFGARTFAHRVEISTRDLERTAGGAVEAGNQIEKSTLARTGGSHQRFEGAFRSEEHTSELQSRENIVCRLLLEKKTTAIEPGTAISQPISLSSLIATTAYFNHDVESHGSGEAQLDSPMQEHVTRFRNIATPDDS